MTILYGYWGKHERTFDIFIFRSLILSGHFHAVYHQSNSPYRSFLVIMFMVLLIKPSLSKQGEDSSASVEREVNRFSCHARSLCSLEYARFAEKKFTYGMCTLKIPARQGSHCFALELVGSRNERKKQACFIHLMHPTFILSGPSKFLVTFFSLLAPLNAFCHYLTGVYSVPRTSVASGCETFFLCP